MQINYQDQIAQLASMVNELMKEVKELKQAQLTIMSDPKIMDKVQDMSIAQDNSSSVHLKKEWCSQDNSGSSHLKNKGKDCQYTKIRYTPSIRGRIGQRGRGGRGIHPSRINHEPTIPFMSKSIKIGSIMDFPSVVPSEKYSDIVKSDKKDFVYECKQYINNFKIISNKLNKNPCSITEDYKGYTTIKHEKINMLIGLIGCQSELVKAAYDYGLLNTLYTTNGDECIKIPKLHRVVTNYIKITKADMIFIKFYGAMEEVTMEQIIPTIQFVKIGLTRDYVLPDTEPEVQNALLHEDIPKFLIKKRAWGFKVMIDALKSSIQKPIWATLVNRIL